MAMHIISGVSVNLNLAGGFMPLAAGVLWEAWELVSGTHRQEPCGSRGWPHVAPAETTVRPCSEISPALKSALA